MKTDHIDILQLHTCTLEELQRGEAIQALQDAKQAGKVRFLGYSGDGDEALWVIESGLFALGFALAPEQVHVANVSMPEPDHVRWNIEILGKLPLATELIAAARQRLEEVGPDWKQLH